MHSVSAELNSGDGGDEITTARADILVFDPDYSGSSSWKGYGDLVKGSHPRDIAAEIWNHYGGREASKERTQTLWELCDGNDATYAWRAERESREWAAWHDILSSQEFPPQHIPGREEVKRLAGTTTFGEPSPTNPRPCQSPSMRHERQKGTWKDRRLTELPSPLVQRARR